MRSRAPEPSPSPQRSLPPQPSARAVGRRPTRRSARRTAHRRPPGDRREPAAGGVDHRVALVSEIYEKAYKGVVEITRPRASRRPRRRAAGQGQGSGFVFDADGHIVTNDHVVEGAEAVSVRFWDGSTYDATVVGTDPSTDLAVIKVDAPASMLVRSRSATRRSVGEGVVALGSPSGSRARSRAASSAPSTGR